MLNRLWIVALLLFVGIELSAGDKSKSTTKSTGSAKYTRYKEPKGPKQKKIREHGKKYQSEIDAIIDFYGQRFPSPSALEQSNNPLLADGPSEGVHEYFEANS